MPDTEVVIVHGREYLAKKGGCNWCVFQHEKSEFCESINYAIPEHLATPAYRGCRLLNHCLVENTPEGVMQYLLKQEGVEDD